MSDNLLLTIAERVEGRPGRPISLPHDDSRLAASIGAVDSADVLWAVRNLEEQNLIKGTWGGWFSNGWLTAFGWARIEELKRAHVASRYAFFARKFANDDLDTLYKNCLRQATSDTGFELRTVTQKAGHIDAIIEDEIRRCRFLIADLSDHNAGAYWEAGLAEGLGKPVIYICRDGTETHFDTDHRQTVRWHLTKFDETAARLKAVIRNTLLGDAKQDD
jgi:nucleoside 2-deoxyribosyltransferase